MGAGFSKRSRHLMGEGATGSIHYDPDGPWMHALLKSDPKLVPPGFQNPGPVRVFLSFLTNFLRNGWQNGRAWQAAVCYASNLSIFYSGPFRVDVDEGVVYHKVQFSSLQHFIGRELPRKYTFNKDGTMTLTTIPLSPEEPVIELLWKRPS